MNYEKKHKWRKFLMCLQDFFSACFLLSKHCFGILCTNVTKFNFHISHSFLMVKIRWLTIMYNWQHNSKSTTSSTPFVLKNQHRHVLKTIWTIQTELPQLLCMVDTKRTDWHLQPSALKFIVCYWEVDDDEFLHRIRTETRHGISSWMQR